MPRKRRHLFLHWIPAMLGIIVIVLESTATMSAANTSRWLLPVWVKLFGPVTPERWEVIHHMIRKTGHFVGYGSISLAFFEGWRYTFAGKPRKRNLLLVMSAAMALLSTLLLASWDEWHQSFLPGRTSTPVDVGIDFSGAFTAHLLLLLILLVVWRIRSKDA